MRNEILTEYQERADSWRHLEQRAQKRHCILGWVIYGSGVAGLTGLFIVWANPALMSLVATIGIVLLPFIGVVAGTQRWSAARRNRYRELRRINQDADFRFDRNWSAIDLVQTNVPDEYSVVSQDLNLFGHASVFHLLCTAQTDVGIRTLRNWLLCEPSIPTTSQIKERQQAVRELSEQTTVRQEITAACRLLRRDRFNAQALLEWAEGQRYAAHRPWLQWMVRIVPLITVAMLTLVLLNVIPQQIGLPIMTTSLFIAVGITVSLMGPVHDIFRRISPDVASATLQRLEVAFTELSQLDGNSQSVTRIRQTAEQARQKIHELKRIMNLSVLSRIPVTFFGVYLPLQFVLLWDFQMLNALERWQQRHGKTLRNWLECLGQFEALAALATVAHDNPNWAFPDFADDMLEFRVEQIGHPLLPAEMRVHKIISIQQPRNLMLVTGSNMSGKSTLLRSIGVNAVLAQAGGPVCAKQMTMPRASVVTSMRIADSLDDGVSLFMAEVKRLKTIVDEAKRLRENPKLTMLVLLDEILHGTNSAERHIAVQRVLTHLLSHDVIGAVTTHDLHLADDSTIKAACQIVHFRESLSGDENDRIRMSFDYKMRPGIAPTTNAVKLMDMIGLSALND